MNFFSMNKKSCSRFVSFHPITSKSLFYPPNLFIHILQNRKVGDKKGKHKNIVRPPHNRKAQGINSLCSLKNLVL